MNRGKNITYWMRLKQHPGLPVMLILTSAFVFVGLANESTTWLVGICIGLISALPYWVIVLWTTRTQPVVEDTGRLND